MRNIELNISIVMRETEASVTEQGSIERKDDGVFCLILNGQDKFDIDRLESALLEVNYSALRAALSEHLGRVIKEEACEKAREVEGGRIEEHPCLYQVDGEVGRFSFKTYDVKTGGGKFAFEGIEMFPKLHGRQWYQTCGFKELALIFGAAQRSYRQTTNIINRTRHQEIGGTPLTTLHGDAEAEGLKVLDFIASKTQSVFKSNEFTPQGVPKIKEMVIKQIPKPSRIRKNVIQPALTAVCAEMSEKGLEEADIAHVRKTACPNKNYEQKAKCVYISIDDVGVKEQKKERSKKGVAKKHPDNQLDTPKGTRPMVQNTVARIEQGDKGFTLTGRSVMEVLMFVLAFLLNNTLLKQDIKFCIDGQRSLQDTILSFFSWHPRLTLLLDWFHVVKKFKEDLSLACKGREIRNRHLKKLLRLLWFGLIDKAKAYLIAIPPADLKNDQIIARLIGYLDRNRKCLPCYAMRSQLHLPNSSNPVERCNNLVTANRQKHHGMSWSEHGSYALTALNAVVINKATRQWVEKRVIPLTWHEGAA